MVNALGDGAGGTGALAIIRGVPGWWVFMAGFVRYFAALQFRVVVSAGGIVVHTSF